MTMVGTEWEVEFIFVHGGEYITSPFKELSDAMDFVNTIIDDGEEWVKRETSDCKDFINIRNVVRIKINKRYVW